MGRRNGLLPIEKMMGAGSGACSSASTQRAGAGLVLVRNWAPESFLHSAMPPSPPPYAACVHLVFPRQWRGNTTLAPVITTEVISAATTHVSPAPDKILPPRCRTSRMCAPSCTAQRASIMHTRTPARYSCTRAPPQARPPPSDHAASGAASPPRPGSCARGV